MIALKSYTVLLLNTHVSRERCLYEEGVRIDGGYATTPDGAKRALVFAAPVGPCLLITRGTSHWPWEPITRAVHPAFSRLTAKDVAPHGRWQRSTVGR